MFDSIKLSTLLALGFGLLVSILILTSTLSFSALSDGNEGFKQYRLLARDTNLAGRLQANMLFVRLYVKEFFKTGSQTSVVNYQSRLAKLNQFLKEAEQEIIQVERTKKIAVISDSINDYVRNFDTVVEFKKERDHLVFDKLDPEGLEMRLKLSAIMKSAFNDRDPDASYYAARIQEHVLLARLYANKFLTSNSPAAAKRVEEEIGIEIDTLVSTLDDQLENPLRRELFSEFLTAKKLYLKHFIALEKLIFKRNRIINKQLDIIGPIISSAAEDVKLSVKKDQDLLGPKLQNQSEEFLFLIGVFSFLGTLFSIIFAWFIAKKIKQPIGGEPLEIMAITQQVAKGKTDIDFQSKHQLTGIFAALQSMVQTLNLRIKLAQDIAQGNWNVEVNLLSKEDTFGLALQAMLAQLKERNEKLLRESKEKSAVMADIEQQSWLKTEVAKVSNLVQGVSDLQALTEKSIKQLAKVISAGHGVFYIAHNSEENSKSMTLKLLGSYAFSQRKNMTTEIHLGEGLVGQCALEKQVIMLTEVPSDYVQISSGLGQHTPLNVIAIPIIFDHNCLGVIELASFHPFTKNQQDLLHQVSVNLGVLINNVLARQRIETLLDVSKKQAEEMQEQQEELKSSNEDLIEQTQQLKASEEELSQQSEELKVSNEELGQRQKDLQAQKDKIAASEQSLTIKANELMIASKYKSEFLANMSHELRTPLNSLLLLAKGLADNGSGNLDEVEVEDAHIIYEGGQSLLSLINDILDLSKVEAGKLNIHIEDTLLTQLRESLLRLFQPLAKNRNVELTIDIADNLPAKISTDCQRLEQILRNLLANAIKFTEMGSVKVLFTQPKADTIFRDENLSISNSLAINVTDTGIGISEDKILDIFEAFQQEDGSTSRRYGGTGLGLTIARELSHLLGGEIQLTSELHKGSCFTLYLPLFTAAETTISSSVVSQQKITSTSTIENDIEAKSTIAREQMKQTILTSKISGLMGNSINNTDQQLNIFIDDDRNSITAADKSLLVIDDDRHFAKILRDHARKSGYKCLVAGDGRSGIYLAQQYQPSGIILDLMLPDIDGHQVLEQLKSSLKTQHIPVEVISAHSENRSEVLAGGAIGLQTKPVSSEQLQQVLIEIENLAKAKIRQVLIIEDNVHHSTATKRLLENIGLKATSVTTGEEGCEAIRSGKYDCVILDLGLPDMTGIELLEQVNSADMSVLPPVIIYTGKEITDEEQKKLDKYSSMIVIKGVGSPERLLDDISLFLHGIDDKFNKIMTDKDKKTMRLLHDEDAVLQGRKILLADDDMRNTYALSKKLIDLGCNVEMANNGKEAIELLENDNDFELILMDTMMPVMDGNEATMAIRAMKQYRKIPIIALTAKTMPEDRDRAIKAGASEYLTKPVDFEKLISILRIWLFKQR
ncbi:two-component system sensor histidine kinase/response regulator [Colwellia sp. 75C3]|uniref:response regulator n=1 Tax=Colwellia sp. 75C3 TaxID=888425 RepID=UPI000C3249FD|nr:response regulator [Colwellia sp. 75C3]PKG82474.1 two-component system sensor histidine kinase/response regulator [Colwellia sp. 75C3]